MIQIILTVFFLGAVKLHTPLLMPRSKMASESGESACFMDHSGMLVTLPYNLRVGAMVVDIINGSMTWCFVLLENKNLGIFISIKMEKCLKVM